MPSVRAKMIEMFVVGVCVGIVVGAFGANVYFKNRVGVVNIGEPDFTKVPPQ